MKWPTVSLSETLASAEIFTDGDWVESKDQDPAGDVRLIQLADIGDGFYIDKSARFLTSTKARELKCTFLKPGDVLVARMPDPLGRACVFPGDSKPCVTVVDVCIVRPNGAHDSRWLMHCLNSASCRNQIASFATGTTRSRIARSNFGKIKIPVPSLSEQRRIAAILDKADELRARRRAALARIEELMQAIFMQLFNGDRYKVNWPEVELGDITDIITGFPFRSEEYISTGEKVKLCRGANVLPGRLDWSDLACWPKCKMQKLSAFCLVPADVVLAMDRPWISEGFKVAQVNADDCPALLVQRVARLRAKGGVPNEFIFYLLKQPSFTRHCRPTETTVPHISPADIRSFKFRMPPVGLLEEFARRISHAEKLRSSAKTSLAQMDALFASLQHRAFRGEL